MNTDWLNEVLTHISEDFEIDVHKTEITEEDLLQGISARVAELMDRDAGLLFSYLYRLDISEKNLNIVINTPSHEPIAYRIARLVLERQKARILSKKNNKSSLDLDGWEW